VFSQLASVRHSPDQHTVERILTAITLLILIASMTIGVWEAVNIPQAVVKGVSEAAVLIAVAISLVARRESTKAWPYVIPLLAIVAIGAIGAIAGEDGIAGAALFARDMLKSAALLFVAYSFAEGRSLRVLSIAVLILAAIQIPVAAGKLILIGIDEKRWIGTMHQSAGQLGILLPLMAIPSLVIVGLAWKSSITWLSGFFSFFAIVNEKRLAILAIPLLALGAWLIVLIQDIVIRPRLPLSTVDARLKTFLAVLAVSVGTFYAGIFFVPSLNPGGTYFGGKVDLRYLRTYTKEYLTRGYVSVLNNPLDNLETDTGIQLGRIALIRAAAAHVASQPLPIALLGFGGSNTSDSYLLGNNRNDIIFKRHRLRGATPFAVRVLIDTGYIGLTLLVGWFVWIVLLIMRRMSDPDKWIVIIAMIALCWHGVVAFDVFLYSSALWTYGVLAPSYFLLLGLLLMHRERLSKLLARARLCGQRVD
jgi:hypothetical protein